MNQLKIYKKFYRLSISPSGSTQVQTYTLIDPFFLSGNTYTSGTGATESTTTIETNVNIVQDNTGVFYANLNSNLYAADVTYDLVWFINYINTAPIKKLSTRFRINTRTIANQIEIEYLNTPLEIEILNGTNEIEII